MSASTITPTASLSRGVYICGLFFLIFLHGASLASLVSGGNTTIFGFVPLPSQSSSMHSAAAVSTCGTTTDNQAYYVLGGLTTTAGGMLSPTNDILKYSGTIDAEQWTTVAKANTIWSARYRHQVVTLPNSAIVIAGGYDSTFNFKNDIWIGTGCGEGAWAVWNGGPSSSWWSPRQGHSMVFFNSALVVLGGYPQYNDVWTLDWNSVSNTLATSWIKRADATWSPRTDHSAVVYDGKLFVIGGYTLAVGQWDSACSNEVWFTTSLTAAWTKIASIPGTSSAGFGMAAAVWGSNLVVTSGVTENESYLTAIYTYSTAAGWTTISATSSNTARYYSSMLEYHNRLVLVSGSVAGDPDTHQVRSDTTALPVQPTSSSTGTTQSSSSASPSSSSGVFSSSAASSSTASSTATSSSSSTSSTSSASSSSSPSTSPSSSSSSTTSSSSSSSSSSFSSTGTTESSSSTVSTSSSSSSTGHSEISGATSVRSTIVQLLALSFGTSFLISSSLLHRHHLLPFFLLFSSFSFLTTACSPSLVNAAATTPAWLNGAAINQWIEINGTSGAGGASLPYSGISYKHSTNEIIIAAAGGHSDSADNRVVSMKLLADIPVWELLMASSTVFQKDVAYYSDGKPTSRHIYQTSHFIPALNRVFLFGVFGAYGNAYTFGCVDAFNLDTKTWDKPGTWLNVSNTGYGQVMIDKTNEVWTSGLGRWSPITKVWTRPITKMLPNERIRAPLAYDSLRDQIFAMQYGDNQGFETDYGVSSSMIKRTGSNTQVHINFNPSSAWTQFQADQPNYSTMDYDAVNDQFMFYYGQGTSAGRIYVIKPNSGTTWDMSILPTTGKLPPASPGDGVHNRFRYIPALKGFMLMPSSATNIWFIRTA